MRRTPQPLVIATVLAVGLSAGCVREYKVTILNELEVPIVLELAQYHSDNFSSTPPKAFTPDLLLDLQQVSLAAGATVTIKFDDAAGGYWVLWRVVEPASRAGDRAVLELSRYRRTIRVAS